MNDLPLETVQQRERLRRALSSLYQRFSSLFNEAPQPRVLSWLSAKIEQEKDAAIRDALSHFEVSDLIELKSIVENQQNPQLRKKRGP